MTTVSIEVDKVIQEFHGLLRIDVPVNDACELVSSGIKQKYTAPDGELTIMGDQILNSLIAEACAAHSIMSLSDDFGRDYGNLPVVCFCPTKESLSVYNQLLMLKRFPEILYYCPDGYHGYKLDARCLFPWDDHIQIIVAQKCPKQLRDAEHICLEAQKIMVDADVKNVKWIKNVHPEINKYLTSRSEANKKEFFANEERIRSK